MRRCDVPPELVRQIAAEAIAAYRQYRDAYEYDRERAESAAIAETAGGRP